MSNHVRPSIVVAVVAAAIGAMVSAAIVYDATDRSQVAALLPVAMLWGALVVGLRNQLDAVRWPWVLGAALLVRLPFVGTPPLLSDDLYRYLFEGRVLWAGYNPLLSAPQTLAGLDDALLASVNHPEVSTVYPPVALLWFRLLALVGTPAAVQLGTALVDAGTAVGLGVATRRAWPAWVYALHPLPALEGAHAGHLDLVAVAFVVWGVAAWRRGRIVEAGTALLAGGGVKLLPFAVMPRVGWRLRDRWPVFVVWGVVGLAISGPVVEAGATGLAGLQTYARDWSFNPFAFALVEPWLGQATRPVLVAVGGFATLVALRHEDPGRTLLGIGTAFVLLSPTVHPWYLLWAVVPGLLCQDARWAAASVFYLPAYTILLTFDPATGEWAEAPAWLPLLTWVPMLTVYGLTPAGSTPPRSRTRPRTAAGRATIGSSRPR